MRTEWNMEDNRNACGVQRPPRLIPHKHKEFAYKNTKLITFHWHIYLENVMSRGGAHNRIQNFDGNVIFCVDYYDCYCVHYSFEWAPGVGTSAHGVLWVFVCAPLIIHPSIHRTKVVSLSSVKLLRTHWRLLSHWLARPSVNLCASIHAWTPNRSYKASWSIQQVVGSLDLNIKKGNAEWSEIVASFREMSEL